MSADNERDLQNLYRDRRNALEGLFDALIEHRGQRRSDGRPIIQARHVGVMERIFKRVEKDIKQRNRP